MSDRCFTGDFDGMSFTYFVASEAAERLKDHSPVEMANGLDRIANRLRREGETDPDKRFTIEMRDSIGPNVAVYDGHGEEYLFTEWSDAVEFVEERLHEDVDEHE